MSEQTQRVAAARIERQQFERDMKATPWYGAYVQRYGEPPNLDATEYDYQKAWRNKVVAQPDPYDQNFPHWPSTLPNGEPLKAATHPTMWKETFMQGTGINPDAIGVTGIDQPSATPQYGFTPAR